MSDDEPSGGALRHGPCDALAAETLKPEEPSVAEATLSMERLIDPEEVEGDLDEEDTWGQRLKGSSKELEFRRLLEYERPFLLQGLFSRAGDCSERARVIKKNWAEVEADAPGDKIVPPPFEGDRNAQRLLQDQESDAETWELLNYLRYKAGEKRAEKIGAKDELRLRSAAAKHSLNDHGLLCRRIHLPLSVAEVPVLPSVGGWRQWAFSRFHDSPLSGHLNAAKTFDKLRRRFVWDRMLPDCEYWTQSCPRCASHRRSGMPLPADPKLEQHTLGPWMDVYVDFVGPYVESVDGYKYACTYTCKLLRVPIIEPVRSLKHGDAMQGVLTCTLRSLTVPAMWRHDLGPEF